MKKSLIWALVGLCLLPACNTQTAHNEKEEEKEKAIAHPILQPTDLFFMQPTDMLVAGNPGANDLTGYLPDFVSYPNDLAKLGLRGPVKSCVKGVSTVSSIFDFDTNGNLVRHQFLLDKSGRYGEGHRMEYDASGHLKSMKYDFRGRTSGSDTYTYSDGKLVKRGSNEWIRTYTWGLTESGQSYPEKVSTQGLNPYLDIDYKLEDNKLYIERMKYRNPYIPGVASADSACSTYEYDPEGRLITVKTICSGRRNKGKPLYALCQYTYNPQGDVAGYEYYLFADDKAFQDPTLLGSALLQESVSYEYQYDEHGNWIFLKPTVKPVTAIGQDWVVGRTIVYYTEEELKQAKLNREETAKKPFVGHWRLNRQEEMEDEEGNVTETITTSGDIVLNLYENFIPDGEEKAIPGLIHAASLPSMGMEEYGSFHISQFKINGNQVDFSFYGLNSETEYSATLLYDPSDRSLTLKDIKETKAGGHEEYASDSEYYDLLPDEGRYEFYNESTSMNP